jgi:hypothetical protein
MCVLLFPQNASKRSRHLSGCQGSSRHLIEQRLKKMKVAFIDQSHLNGRSPQSLRREQPSEPAAKNEYAVTCHGAGLRLRSGCSVRYQTAACNVLMHLYYPLLIDILLLAQRQAKGH